MRRLTFILFSVLCFANANGQSVDGGALDTIIKVEGKIMPVEVTKVTSTYVKFRVPGSDEPYTELRKNIHKIIYKNGRVEEFNSLVMTMIDEYSWEAVWLTEDEKDVVSLYKRGTIEAKSPPSSRSPKAAKKSAQIRLQKKAAGMKGMVVLVTKRQTTGGYGEMPGYEIEGIVYGSEPLEEEGSKGDIL